MPHPNNKQDKNTNPIISRQDYSLTQTCPSEEEKEKLTSSHQNANTSHILHKTGPQKNKHHKTGPTTPTEGRNQKEERIQPLSLRKGDLKHSTLKKEKKRQRNIV